MTNNESVCDNLSVSVKIQVLCVYMCGGLKLQVLRSLGYDSPTLSP